MPYCPKCGKEVSDDDTFCPHCGEILKKAEVAGAPQAATAPSRQGAIKNLTFAFNLASKKPMVFVPALIGSVISIILSALIAIWLGAYAWQFMFGTMEGLQDLSGFMALAILSGIVGLVGVIISYIMLIASIDMSRDAYLNAPLNLGESIRYVFGRIGTFILATIVGAILSITIILIPVVLLMFVIMVVDETGIGNSISKAFGVLGKRLGDVLILLVISIVGGLILGYIPYIGSLLDAVLNVVIGLAFIDLYVTYKKGTAT